jgi:DNA-binding MarR family transcriptional regulator
MSADTIAAALRAAARTRAGSMTVRALAAAIEVNRTPEPIGQTDIRALLGASDMQASRAIGLAVRHGLIRREQRTGGDRRRVLLHPTPDGRHLVAFIAKDRSRC